MHHMEVVYPHPCEVKEARFRLLHHWCRRTHRWDVKNARGHVERGVTFRILRDNRGEPLQLSLPLLVIGEDENEDAVTPPPVPTPYFTPEFFFDPASPPSTPDVLEIAMCISHRVPVRWTRPVPPAPKAKPMQGWSPDLGITLTAGRGWGNLLRLAHERGDWAPCNDRAGLGFDIPRFQEATLEMHIEHPPPLVESVRSHLSLSC
ncbi:hypothetical protein PsYK624_016060 [Phanerochaete sordida]|uniref:Uncharacterized protein n=1 Tax=Phanerochaete sordida TaxID=48140 RepID=A0A9P3L9A7_9APHY|nr:hypothetical protein PsYK624_016060 [Phanerochaete sordida]